LRPLIADVVSVDDGNESLGVIGITDEELGDLGAIGDSPARRMEEMYLLRGLVDGDVTD
jgi:hypothetical protein